MDGRRGQEDRLLLKGEQLVLVYQRSGVLHSGLSICDMTDEKQSDLFLLWH